MQPVALAVAEDIQTSPDPVLLLLTLGASSAVMTPVSPINALVMPDGKRGSAGINCQVRLFRARLGIYAASKPVCGDGVVSP